MFWNKEKNRLQAELIEERNKACQAEERAREAEAQLASFKNKPTLYCSFCSKSQHQVHQLIAGPTVFICNECVHLCIEVLENGKHKTGGAA